MESHLEQMLDAINHTFEASNQKGVVKIPLTKRMFALIDKRFEEDVLRYRWYTANPQVAHVYAVAVIDGTHISLQRLVWHLSNPNSTLQTVKNVSFHNKCSLDCRIENLLGQLNRQAMARNRKKKNTSASQFKGLRKRLRGDGTVVWFATIRIDGGDLSLGVYEDEAFAAQVYDAAACLFFGESAQPNFRNTPPSTHAIEIVKQRFAKFNEKRNIPN